ncbi:MAG TPA: TonB family protein [Pyrinomonadaceae bacterium]|nr:TonB family protein [Pyrinomonadaceae bacterium]
MLARKLEPNGTGDVGWIGGQMFNNLIESSSHTREFKRRGSFVLFTTATYVLFFIIAGVISIYAYDARLEEPNNIIVTMLSPVELARAPAPVPHNAPPPRDNGGRSSLEVVRQVPMANVNHPELVPEGTSAAPNKNPPVPDGVPFRVGPDSDPMVPGGTGHNRSGGTGAVSGGASPVIDVGPPPPARPPIERTAPRVVSKGPITGLAIYLPKPPYPQIARQARAHGAVNVQVLVDESGKVISAKVVNGHPLLMSAAQQAAMAARFSPTRLGDQAVKVSGMITYNFVLE